MVQVGTKLFGTTCRMLFSEYQERVGYCWQWGSAENMVILRAKGLLCVSYFCRHTHTFVEGHHINALGGGEKGGKTGESHFFS